MARSYKLKIFGVESLDDLTAEQYHLLVESEIFTFDAKSRALKDAQAKATRNSGRRGVRKSGADPRKGETVSIRTS